MTQVSFRLINWRRPLPLVAFVGEGVVVGGWRLVAKVLLDCIIDVSGAARGVENLAEVRRALRYIHWRRCRESELVGTGVRGMGSGAAEDRIATSLDVCACATCAAVRVVVGIGTPGRCRNPS